MANDGYSRQGNPFSRGGINARIIQGNNFSGTVVDSLSSGPDGPDRVWGTPPPVVQGGPAPAPRTRPIGFATYEVMSPLQRAQEQSNQNNEPPVFITVRRRNTSLNGTARFEGRSEEERETHLRECRAAFVHEYNTVTDPTLQRLLALCAPLLNINVDIERKYVELDILRVFEANKIASSEAGVLNAEKALETNVEWKSPEIQELIKCVRSKQQQNLPASKFIVLT